MSSRTQRGSVFKRLETDDELRARLSARVGLPLRTIAGNALDEYAWVWYKMQRRIIEVEA
jgi:hypothetical protein